MSDELTKCPICKKRLSKSFRNKIGSVYNCPNCNCQWAFVKCNGLIYVWNGMSWVLYGKVGDLPTKEKVIFT